MSRREELAWAAGFFDGEGTTYVQNPGQRKATARVSIQQMNREVLDRFALAVGVGHVVGPYVANRRDGHQANPFWTYNAASWRDCQAVIGLLWAFLSKEKRLQARRCLEAMRDARGEEVATRPTD